MRIIFMGTPDFAAVALQHMLNAGLNVVAVYTQPPKPAGRGHELKKSATQQLAERYNITVRYPENFKSIHAEDELRSFRPDICVVAAYGFILPKTILNIPSLGCINIHASLLPRWRGASPIQHAILAGDTTTGITLIKMDTGMDTGDILYQRFIPITQEITSQILFEYLSVLGGEMIVEYLQNPTLYGAVPQPEEGITLASKLHKSMSYMDWSKSAIQLDQQFRAFIPWPGTLTVYKNTILKLNEIRIVNGHHDVEPGTILNHNLHVACGNGTIISIGHLQRSGGKMLPAEEFLKGFPMYPGDRFTLPKMI